MGLLVTAFRDGVADPAFAQVGAHLAGAVALLAQGVVRAGAGPAGTGPRDLDGAHDVFEAGAVADVPTGEYESERSASALADEVNLRGQSASGASEGVITYFLPRPRPFLRAPAAC